MAQDRFSNPKYIDWVRVKLSLQYAKEGLEPITEQNATTFHTRLSSRLQAPSSSSATGGPITCNSCVKDDFKRQWGKRKFYCGNGICDGWLDSLLKEHVQLAPQFTPRVKWDNFDVSQLPLKRWECLKLFLPKGSKNVQGAVDCDLAAILTLFLNCRHFASNMNDVNLCKKVKEVRNRLLHTGTMEVDRAQMQSDIGLIKQLLSDPAFAADRACQEALTKIDKLARDKLELSLNKELESKVLNSDIKSVVVETGQLKQDMVDLTNQVQQECGKLRTDVRGVTTDVSSLKDQLRTEISGMTTEVSSLKDQLKAEVSGVTTEVTSLKDQLKTAVENIVELQSVADLLCRFIHACHIVSQVEIFQLTTSISTLSTLRAEMDGQGQILAQLQETMGRHEITLEQHGAMLEQYGGTLEQHEGTLEQYGRTQEQLEVTLEQYGGTLEQHRGTLEQHKVTLEQHGGTLEQYGGTLEQHGGTLEEHERKINTIEADLSANRAISDRQKPEMADVAALQQHLLAVYKDECKWENPVTADEDKPVTISQMYVKPAIKLVRQRDQNERLATVQQNQRENESMPLSYKNIFYTNKEHCQNIYITGNAGMGKTTFCKKLVHTWVKAIQNIAEEGDSVEDMGVLKEFKLLFYVNLREVDSQYHIEKMIKQNVLHDFRLSYDISHILENENCLVVMDGLDEWSCPQNAEICRGLNKHIPGRNTMNKNCTYLTTTRSWKFDVINLKSKDCDKHVELCGISGNLTKEFAKKTLCCLNPESQYKIPIDDFFKEVQKKKLDSLTQIPVLLIHLVTLWYSCKDLGQSQVQLYCKMLELLLEQAENHLSEKSSTVKKPVQKGANLPGCFSKHEANCHNHAQLVLCLSKLAFMSLSRIMRVVVGKNSCWQLQHTLHTYTFSYPTLIISPSIDLCWTCHTIHNYKHLH